MSEPLQEYIRRETIQTGVPHINLGILRRIPVLLPPLPEQRKIARILGTWDRALAQLDALIAAKEQRLKGLAQRLLTGEDRFPEFRTEEWEELPLQKIVTSTNRSIDKPDEKYLRLGIRSHGKGTFLKPNQEPEWTLMTTLYQVKKDDLIVNITFAWEGAIAIARKRDEGALTSHRFPSYEFNRDVAIPEYFRYVIVQPRITYLLGLISPGGAGRNRVLSKTDFLKLEVLLPAVKEQRRIAEVLRAAETEVTILRRERDALAEQKKGLMQLLLTGEVRVMPDPEDYEHPNS